MESEEIISAFRKDLKQFDDAQEQLHFIEENFLENYPDSASLEALKNGVKLLKIINHHIGRITRE